MGRDDDHTQGGEPLGEWYGLGVEALGVSGECEKQATFTTSWPASQLMARVMPRSTAEIHEEERTRSKRTGEGCRNLSGRTSFRTRSQSVGAVSDAELRRAIQEAHDRAVKSALDFAQTEAGFSRVGKGGTEEVRADFAVAIFQHGTSRSLDPHLHSHAVVLNVAPCEDGKHQTWKCSTPIVSTTCNGPHGWCTRP